jgi:hypothetical protein
MTVYVVLSSFHNGKNASVEAVCLSHKIALKEVDRVNSSSKGYLNAIIHERELVLEASNQDWRRNPMSYIRGYSNPEGLYIWSDREGVHISHNVKPPLATLSNFFVVPYELFLAAIKTWSDPYLDEDIGFNRDRLIVVEEMETRSNKTLIRFQYKDDFFHMFLSTWMFVVLQNKHRSSSKKKKGKVKWPAAPKNKTYLMLWQKQRATENKLLRSWGFLFGHSFVISRNIICMLSSRNADGKNVRVCEERYIV